MAETWARKKCGKVIRTNPRSRVDALAARRVLRDCYRARTKFAKASTEADRRLWWILSLTLLRATGHVLHKVDSKRSKYMGSAIRNAFSSWKASPRRHLIFHEFIEKERNEIIKEYQIDPAISLAPEVSDDLPSLLLIGDHALAPEAAIETALRWWEEELHIIEEEAKAALATAKPSGRRA